MLHYMYRYVRNYTYQPMDPNSARLFTTKLKSMIYYIKRNVCVRCGHDFSLHLQTIRVTHALCTKSSVFAKASQRFFFFYF